MIIINEDGSKTYPPFWEHKRHIITATSIMEKGWNVITKSNTTKPISNIDVGLSISKVGGKISSISKGSIGSVISKVGGTIEAEPKVTNVGAVIAKIDSKTKQTIIKDTVASVISDRNSNRTVVNDIVRIIASNIDSNTKQTNINDSTGSVVPKTGSAKANSENIIGGIGSRISIAINSVNFSIISGAITRKAEAISSSVASIPKPSKCNVGGLQKYYDIAKEISNIIEAYKSLVKKDIEEVSKSQKAIISADTIAKKLILRSQPVPFK